MPGPDATTSIAHSILWLCAALTDGTAPMVLVIDDGHWADRPSLEVISYVARRVCDVPVLIVVAFRPDVPGAASDLLTLIGDGRFTQSLVLQAPDGRRLGGAHATFRADGRPGRLPPMS